MKKIFVLLLGFIPMFLFAGVIMTTNDERIADVSIQSENDSTIIYLQNGVEKSIAIEQISAILYDDGKYMEFAKQYLESKQDVTDSVEVIDLTKVDTDDIDIYAIDLDSCTYLSTNEKKLLNNQIKQARDLATRKQTSSNSSRIVGPEAYITAYLQLRARGYSRSRAEFMATISALKECKKSRTNKKVLR